MRRTGQKAKQGKINQSLARNAGPIDFGEACVKGVENGWFADAPEQRR
jgi:hypothetical protein